MVRYFSCTTSSSNILAHKMGENFKYGIQLSKHEGLLRTINSNFVNFDTQCVFTVMSLDMSNSFLNKFQTQPAVFFRHSIGHTCFFDRIQVSPEHAMFAVIFWSIEVCVHVHFLHPFEEPPPLVTCPWSSVETCKIVKVQIIIPKSLRKPMVM